MYIFFVSILHLESLLPIIPGKDIILFHHALEKNYSDYLRTKNPSFLT